MKNPGYIFEERLYKVLTRQNIYWKKFSDFAGIGYGDNIRFTPTNPYDFFFFYKSALFCIEAKSTNKNSFTIGLKKMIKPHQVAELYKASKHAGVFAGFLFELRDEDKVYFMHIKDFISITNDSSKKSIHKKEIEEYGLLVAWSQETFKDIPEELWEAYNFSLEPEMYNN